MTYDDYGPEVNAILDVARAGRRLSKLFPDTSPSDLLQHLEGPAQNWTYSLIEIILDYEERCPE